MKELWRIRNSDHGSFIVDRRGTILGFDEAMEGLTGWPAVQIVGRSKDLHGAVPSPTRESGDAGIGPLYEGDVVVGAEQRLSELSVRCRDGRTLSVEAAAERLPGPGERTRIQVLRIVAVTAGGAGRSDPQRRDILTGLPNAEPFAVRLAAGFAAASASARPLALILLDIDHLREVNDRWGHEVGDEVLRRVAGILRVQVEDESCLCRLGDDDFAILMPDAGRGDARQLAAGIRSIVERHRIPIAGAEGDGVRVTLSLGAASFPADAESAGDLMERAAEALDEARSMGRNRVWCYLRRPRVPVQVPVYFEGAEALLVGYTRDLSPSGVFVQTSAPIDIGMRCALTFPLPGHEGKVHVIGRIVRTVPPEMEAEVQVVRIPGMGVEFERFGGASDRRAIERFLHANESKTLRPENGKFSI